LSTNNPLLAVGYYQHYKGPYYQVLAVVRHSEEAEHYVLYRALYGDFGLWVRPLSMFTEQVQSPQGLVARFRYLGKTAPTDCPTHPALQQSAEQVTSIWPGLG